MDMIQRFLAAIFISMTLQRGRRLVFMRRPLGIDEMAPRLNRCVTSNWWTKASYFPLVSRYVTRIQSNSLNGVDIPVIISVRKKRMKILRIIAIVFVLALLVKAASLIAISGSTIITKYSYVLVLMVIFYCILELFPMATVLAFYQVREDSLAIEISMRLLRST